MARPGIIYAPKARADIRKLLAYTHDTWGSKQVPIYAGQLEKALDHLCDYPESGHIEIGLRQRQRAYIFGSHKIIYSLRAGDLYIARILHQNMSVRKHL